MNVSTQACFHCKYLFDLDNLKKECRRQVNKTYGDVNIVNILSKCYDLEEESLHQLVEDEDCFICSKCFNAIKSIAVQNKKNEQTIQNLKSSSDFGSTVDLHSSLRKRRRDALSPLKSGCTPRGKSSRLPMSTPSTTGRKIKLPPAATPKNRRRLNFNGTPTATPRKTKESPGPRVKVHLKFRKSSRKTVLQGKVKLVCRALVLKQYRTAFNHLIEIEDVKKELVNQMKKKMQQEIRTISKKKNFVLRGSNIKKFSWKNANSQLTEACPLIMELFNVFGNGKQKQLPRIVTSLAILLFNFNQQINTLQAINSILMYRGHVRTKVYSTLNRAGLCNSYKATLSMVDKICEDFDLPVKKWSNQMSEDLAKTTNNPVHLEDHTYALAKDSSQLVVESDYPEKQHIYTAEPLSEEEHPIYSAEPLINEIPKTSDFFDDSPASQHCFTSYLQTPCHKSTPVRLDSPIDETVGQDSLLTPLINRYSTDDSPASQHCFTSYLQTPCHKSTPVRLDSPIDETVGQDSLLTPLFNRVPTDPTLELRTPIQTNEGFVHIDVLDSPFNTVNAKECYEDVSGFQIVMDNLNLNQKTRHKTLDTNNKVHNLTHSMAVKHRIDDSCLDLEHPQADILSLPNDIFIPSETEYIDLEEDLTVLVQRALVEFIPALKDFESLVTKHIPHQHSEISKRKSCVVPLGILEKDENITEQMIDIIEHLQQYVPKDGSGKMSPILLGGDALSVERGVTAQKARADGLNQHDRLEGFIWKSEDWHGHVISLQDTFTQYYSGSSSGEKGTLFMLRNLFDRRGVKAEVKDAVNECREFLRFVTKGFIVLAAMHILDVEDLESITEKVNELVTKEDKIKFLEKLSTNIVTFVQLKRIHLPRPDTEKSRTACGYPGCPKTFATDGKCRQKHREICTYKAFDGVLSEPLSEEDEGLETNEVDSKSDFKFNYTCSVLRDGLLDWCREDACKENDGDRIFRLWKLDMLRFSLNNHTKYRLLAFKMQAQILALLPPRLAYQLKYNRTVNIHGGPGGNVPCDLALEFFNMRAKDALHSLHGNMTSSSIKRVGRSLQGCNDLIDNYTTGLNQFFGKPSNSKPSLQKDVELLVERLQPEELFVTKPGRSHKSFPKTMYDRLERLNTTKLDSWLTEKKEECAITQCLKSF